MERGSRKVRAAVALLIVALTLGIYGQTGGFDFVGYDDGIDVYQNPYVRQGLTARGLRWALTAPLLEQTRWANYWMPSTILSHMAVVELFGLDAGPHHLVNVALHALNSVLLFLLLRRLFGPRATGRSALAALLFAAHPVHVESVAWVTERKDVLSGLFYLLALHAYVGYARAPSARRYLGVLAIFLVGTTAKPILVTLPGVLLLVDWWPLGRVRLGRLAVTGAPTSTWRRVLLEKLPFAAVGAAVGVVTYFALVPALVEGHSFAALIVGYAAYLELIVWPHCLAVLYPARSEYPLWQALIAGGVLLSITTLAVAGVRRAPWVLWGWLWFLGVLFPVSGVAQAGDQAWADRFLYLPAIGVYVSVAWGAGALARRFSLPAAVRAGLAAALVSALAVAAFLQTRHWRDSGTLFRRALACTQENHVAHHGLAYHLIELGELDEAERHLREAIAIRPERYTNHLTLGRVYMERQRPVEALPHLREAVRLNPESPDALYELGGAQLRLQRLQPAEATFRKLLDIDPDHAQARGALGAILAMTGRVKDARMEFERALALDPFSADVHAGYAGLLAQGGQVDLAIEHLERALALEPDHATASSMLDFVRGRRR